jgi:signal transduction histidine kinase
MEFYRGIVNESAVATPEHRRRYERRVDVLIAIAVAIVDVGGSYIASRHHTGSARAWDAGAAVVLLVGAGALVFRRVHPVAVLAVAFGTTLAYTLIGYPEGPIWFALIVAFFTAVTSGHRRAAQISLVAGFFAFLWVKPLLHRGPGPGFVTALGLLAWLLLLLVAAEVRRVHVERVREGVRTREEEARRRASEERLLIAREVHDIVAHNMSLINVQAASALYTFDNDQERARAALGTIKDASKQALVELRSVLGVLRDVDERVPLTPTPGADRLNELVDKAGTTGLTVHLAVEGERRRLPPAVDVATYRIVQESLTNVTRHAKTSNADVRVEYGARDLVVEVDDEGNGARPNGARIASGNGIAGMRERAALLGGTLQAGPRPDGGFRVRAWFPLEPVE